MFIHVTWRKKVNKITIATHYTVSIIVTFYCFTRKCYLKILLYMNNKYSVYLITSQFSFAIKTDNLSSNNLCFSENFLVCSDILLSNHFSFFPQLFECPEDSSCGNNELIKMKAQSFSCINTSQKMLEFSSYSFLENTIKTNKTDFHKHKRKQFLFCTIMI